MNKQFTSKEEFKWALRLFWVIYHLDRHWSFGTGLPFAIQDIDIDPQLPEPVSSSTGDGCSLIAFRIAKSHFSSCVLLTDGLLLR